MLLERYIYFGKGIARPCHASSLSCLKEEEEKGVGVECVSLVLVAHCNNNRSFLALNCVYTFFFHPLSMRTTTTYQSECIRTTLAARAGSSSQSTYRWSWHAWHHVDLNFLDSGCHISQVAGADTFTGSDKAQFRKNRV